MLVTVYAKNTVLRRHVRIVLLPNPPTAKLPLVVQVTSIDILYTLDSASNYSAIQKLKP